MGVFSCVFHVENRPILGPFHVIIVLVNELYDEVKGATKEAHARLRQWDSGLPKHTTQTGIPVGMMEEDE